MWRHLRLESLGVISDAELELGPGFTVITGETGAGKTMIVTALDLLRGERARTGVVRHEADRARVEAIIETTDPQIVELVTEAGGHIEDELVLGRQVSAAGRSRAIAGGATVPAGLLARLTDRLVAVHGQSDQQRLVKADEQRRALDRFAGAELEQALNEHAPLWTSWKEAQKRLETLQTSTADRLQRVSVLRHGLEQIESVAPEPGEDRELAETETRLAHAEGLAAAAVGAAETLSGAELDVTTTLNGVIQTLESQAGHDSNLDELTARVRSASIELADVASELHAYGSAVEFDPARLASVQERRAELGRLQRVYGPTLDDVLEWRAKAAAELTELDLSDTQLEQLAAEVQQLADEVNASAARITRLRSAAATKFAAEVEAELVDLALEHARLSVQIQPAEVGRNGADQVQFLFAANSGAQPQPLGIAASGGELSRIMLAIEVVLAGRDPVPTIVFDEVDAGIGGRTAREVGRRLARLAQHTQVIAVTHLAQVASCADAHFVVSKSDDGTVTSSDVRRLVADDRVVELTRMLSGHEDSSAAQEHARELLAQTPK